MKAIKESNLLFPKKISNQQDSKEAEFSAIGSFSCSECPILFTDFEVRQNYKKTLKMINRSGSKSRIRNIYLSQEMPDIFFIKLEDHEYVADGLSILVEMMFIPTFRKDISVNLIVETASEKIEVPIKCTYVKTKVNVEKSVVELNETITRESSVMKFHLQNVGGQSSGYEVRLPKRKSDEIVSEDQEYFEKEIFNRQLIFTGERKLEGYSYSTINFEFYPKLDPGRYSGKIAIHFEKFLDQQDIHVDLLMNVSKPPISIINPQIDLGICLLDQLYRQEIEFVNTSSHVCKAEIKIGSMQCLVNEQSHSCSSSQSLSSQSDNQLQLQPLTKVTDLNEISEFFQFNPVFSYIQAESSFKFWLKVFINKKFISKYSQFLFEGNRIKVNFELECSIQINSVNFSVELIWTTDRLVFPPKLDFGMIYEKTSRMISAEFKNESLIVQKIFFPKTLNPILGKKMVIEPDLIPYQISPGDSLSINIKYNAIEAGKESGLLRGKYQIGNQKTGDFEIRYSVDVYNCPLQLSYYRFDMKVVQPGEEVMVSILLKNTTKKNLLYKINLPPNNLCGLRVSPKGGKLKPGEMSEAFLEFTGAIKKLNYEEMSSLLYKDDIIEELELKNKDIDLEINTIKNALEQKGISKVEQARLIEQQNFFIQKSEDLKSQLEDRRVVLKETFDMVEALKTLGGKEYSKVVEGDEEIKIQFYSWTIPISFKAESDPDSLASSTFVEVNTAVKPPALQLDRNEIDFGEVLIGQRKKEEIVLTNYTDKEVAVKLEMGAIFAGFQFLSCLKIIPPRESKKFSMALDPLDEELRQEDIILYDDHSVKLRLKGKGVLPKLTTNIDKGILEIGNLLIRESKTKKFSISNPTDFDMEFTIEEKIISGECPSFKPAFYVIPKKAIIKKKSNYDISITFQPIKESENFVSYFEFLVYGRECGANFVVRGSAFSRQCFLKWRKEITNNTFEDNLKLFANPSNKNELKMQSISFTNKVSISFLEEEALKAFNKNEKLIRTLNIGCCQIGKYIGDKGCEFKIELDSDDKRWSVVPSSGKIEAGKIIEVTVEYLGGQAGEKNKKEQKGGKKNIDALELVEEFLPTYLKDASCLREISGKVRLIGGYCEKSESSERVVPFYAKAFDFKL